MDLLPEIKVPPHFRPPTSELLPLGLAAEVDSYLATRQPATFLTGLKQRLMLPEHEYINSGYGTKYNVELLNSLVFYVGIRVSLKTQSMRQYNIRNISHPTEQTAALSCKLMHTLSVRAAVMSVSWQSCSRCLISVPAVTNISQHFQGGRYLSLQHCNVRLCSHLADGCAF